MTRRSLALALLTVSAFGCSGSGTAVDEPTPEAAAPQLTTLLVIQDAGRLRQGDTVRVGLSSLDAQNQVGYYRGGRRMGLVAYDALGPRDGTMMVTASSLNVRNCRSTGCTVVGQVSRGQRVRVWDFAGRWYRYESGGVRGYLNVEHLVLPDAYEGRLFAEISGATRAYYERELARRRVTSFGNVFTGYDVKRVDSEVRFEFYTRFLSGPAAQAACDAMEGISDFVQRTMALVPGEFFSAYSAGVYYDDPNTGPNENLMVAGMAGAGGAHCAIDN
ncbi:MAG TPA: SH3 domain-containing protein [Gemmatimonadota bacterium]|nr:SH3 domain-containing protein [Gemmatimonadota bacterium]